ncbi:MAG: hypothetical protein MUE32_11605 [Bacteroidales bacterium]|jgi:hypothetical protein|nr:hypothetical protein [Bacteroidales bacterium]
MRTAILRKIFVALIMLTPLVSYQGCKKQPKCGCGKDELFTLTKAQATVYWTTGASITFNLLGDPYSTYMFCNPGEMFPSMKNYSPGDVLQVSGHVYWECNYLMNASNSSSYASYYKVYQIQVTEVTVDMYGKK